MKKFQDLNYYEVLEVPPNASDFEIRQAYKEAIAIYDEDALASYSLFEEGEREEVLEKIEEAFDILVDKHARAAYDKMLLDSGKIDPSLLKQQDKNKPIPLFQSRDSFGEDAFSKRVKEKTRDKDLSGVTGQILAKEQISGKDLKKLREFLGITLDEIFEVTRIGVSTLKAIEENDFESLPSSVYLKNFLKTYAEFLKIDPNRVIDGYMKNIAPENN
ncbi:MAG: helix-turn-helix domain-containing protein [Deltaproteobacteria bacterium]|nr:helix-turn-helix domain-containing protein [Deltaproteobacteria bacterium]